MDKKRLGNTGLSDFKHTKTLRTVHCKFLQVTDCRHNKNISNIIATWSIFILFKRMCLKER